MTALLMLMVTPWQTKLRGDYKIILAILITYTLPAEKKLEKNVYICSHNNGHDSHFSSLSTEVNLPSLYIVGYLNCIKEETN